MSFWIGLGYMDDDNPKVGQSSWDIWVHNVHPILLILIKIYIFELYLLDGSKILLWEGPTINFIDLTLFLWKKKSESDDL